MDRQYEKKYHTVANKNWWFVARRDMILNLLPKHANKILDIGCSGGILLKTLKDKGYNVSGCDISAEAIDICKKRGIRDVLCADAKKLPYPDEHFDTIIASDILEHVKEDVHALKEWSRVLKRNGTLIIFVPAHKSLWSEHDIVNHHFRRYNKKMLISRIRRTDLNIRRISYWNSALFIPVYIFRRLNHFLRTRKKRSGDLHELNPIVNFILTALLKTENLLLRSVNLPAGISIFAILRKKQVTR